MRSGRLTAPTLVGLAALSALALGVPMGSLVYWMVRGSSTTLPSASILSAAEHTAAYSAAAAVLATALAVPLSALAIRHRNRVTVLLERLAYLPMALPGLVIALGLVSFSVRYAFSLYQSAFELIVAYAILFLPLALVGVRSAMGQSPPHPGGGGTLAGRSAGERVAARDAATDRTRPRRGVRAGVHLLGHRADRDAAAAPDRREHARHAVLGVHLRILLWRGSPIRCSDGADLGDSRLSAESPYGTAHAHGIALVSLLSVDGLWKGYAGAPVLQGLELDVPAGSLASVLGLSGCGKTTLLRVIAGFERAERGSVSLGGLHAR